MVTRIAQDFPQSGDSSVALNAGKDILNGNVYACELLRDRSPLRTPEFVKHAIVVVRSANQRFLDGKTPERKKLWTEFLNRVVIEELDVAKLACPVLREGEAPAEPRGGNERDPRKDGSAGASPSRTALPKCCHVEILADPAGEFCKIFTRSRDPTIEPVRS